MRVVYIVCLLTAFLVLVSGMQSAQTDSEGLVASWDFTAGDGDVLHDRSGNGNHGAIHGAKWVKVGTGWALEFDGRNSYVDCGTGPMSNAGNQFTVEIWVYATDRPADYDSEVPILGSLSSFGLYRYRDEVWAYIIGGSIGHRVNAFLPYDKWVHMAMTYDGTFQRLYLDGRFAGAAKPSCTLLAGIPFILADDAGGKRFRGMIGHVKLYNRCLSSEEILHDLNASFRTQSVITSPVPVVTFGQVRVELDATRLGVPLRGVSVTVEALSPGTGRVVALKNTHFFDSRGRAIVALDFRNLPKGSYLIRTTARDVSGRAVGVRSMVRLSWPGVDNFGAGPVGTRRLNNFVTELLFVKGPDSSGREWTFTNPRTGWIYVSNLASDRVRLTGPDRKSVEYALHKEYDDVPETMRFLPAGRYTISSKSAKSLTVRTAGYSIHATANLEPQVNEFGPYGGAFEEKYVFPHVNTLEILPYDEDKPFVREWRAKGRMILPHLHYGIEPKEGQSKEDAAFEKLINQPGFSHPNCDGNNCDEFGSPDESAGLWAQALERALDDPKYAGRRFFPYSYRPFEHFDDPHGRRLLAAAKKSGGVYLWEAYVKDQRTELDAWRNLNQVFADHVSAYLARYPDAMESIVVCCYTLMSAPNEYTPTLPEVDPKVFMEMQFNMAATHPAFRGCPGILTYRSNFADPEMVRWAARLYRHYCIEGRMDMLSKYPYLLIHLKNPAFEEQGTGWRLQPAEPDSIQFDVMPGLGHLAGNYPPTSEGDTTVVTTRSEKAPNMLSQTLTGLVPGRLYCLRMAVVDADDLSAGRSRKEKHALSITLGNTAPLAEQSFEAIYPSIHALNGFTHANPLWLNYYVKVFRARDKTAELSISDWSSPQSPGGPPGRKLAFEFIRVQPYHPTE